MNSLLIGEVRLRRGVEVEGGDPAREAGLVLQAARRRPEEQTKQ